MKFNHSNLYSHDTAADRAMFEHYFGFRTLVERGTKMAILDHDGLMLIVNHFDNRRDGFDYPKNLDILHIGFILETRYAVNAMHARLHWDGWETQAPHEAHGASSFYFRANGGYFIEMTTLTPIHPEEAYHGDRA